MKKINYQYIIGSLPKDLKSVDNISIRAIMATNSQGA